MQRMELSNVTTSEMDNVSMYMGNSTSSPEIILSSSRIRYIIRLFISCFLSPSVMIIGIIGNALTVKIFRVKKNKSASSIFIMILAASDTFLLVCKAIYTIYTFGFLVFPYAVSRIPVRSASWLWLADLPERLGKLLTIGIMSERIFAVFFPLKLKQVWTRKRTRNLIVAITILILLTGLPPYIDILYFGFVFSPDDYEFYTPLQDTDIYVRNIEEWSSTLQFINRLIFDLISLFIIFVLCVITSLGIKGLMTNNSLSFSDLELLRRRKKERKITITMLAMSSLFFLLCSPLDICGVLVKLDVIAMFDVPLEVASLLHVLLHMNSMVNFIIYGLADKALRREYIMQLKCCGCRRSDNKAPENQIEILCQTAKTQSTSVNTNVTHPSVSQNKQESLSPGRPSPCSDISANKI